MSSKVTYSTLTKIVQEVEMATWDRYRTISDISDKTVKEIITKGSSNALTYGIPSLGIAAGIGGALAAGGVAFAGGTIAEGGAAIGGVAAGHALKGGVVMFKHLADGGAMAGLLGGGAAAAEGAAAGAAAGVPVPIIGPLIGAAVGAGAVFVAGLVLGKKIEKKKILELFNVQKAVVNGIDICM